MKYLFAIIILIVVVLGWYGAFKYSHKYHTLLNAPAIQDTIIIRDTVTITELVPKEVINKETIEDTLISIKDSTLVPVFLPIEEKIYGDSTFRAVISGYKVKMDSITIYPTTTIINKNKLIRTKEKGFIIKPSIGLGYGITTRKPDIWIGLSITYTF